MSRELTKYSCPVAVTQFCGKVTLPPSDRRMVQITNQKTGMFVQVRYCDFVDMISQVLPELLERAH